MKLTTKKFIYIVNGDVTLILYCIAQISCEAIQKYSGTPNIEATSKGFLIACVAGI